LSGFAYKVVSQSVSLSTRAKTRRSVLSSLENNA